MIKLHGSIDWHAEGNGSVIRCREGGGYPERAGSVLIYPQSTKYVATQRDPFASLFEKLCEVLRSPQPMVFAICGYSFGDEHVDLQIEEAMARPDCKTVLVAFVREQEKAGVSQLPDKLVDWMANKSWATRIFALTDKGLYHGSTTNLSRADVAHEWWTFEGGPNSSATARSRRKITSWLSLRLSRAPRMLLLLGAPNEAFRRRSRPQDRLDH